RREVPTAVEELECRNPTTGMACCCARAASGQAAPPPPSSVMNSRRLIVAPQGSKPRTASSHSRPGLGTGSEGCELRPILLPANVGFGSHDRIKTGKTQKCNMVSSLRPRADLPADLTTT